MNEDKIGSFYNGDTVYLPSLYKDVFVDGFSLSGWRLGPAPSFFPDMLLYFILMFITNNLTISSCMFAIIQTVSLLLLFATLLKLIFPGFFRDGLSAACIIFSIILFFSIISRTAFGLFIYMFIPNYHFSIFLMSIASLLLFIKYIQSHNFKHLAIMSILTFLAVSSDLLFLEMFILPAMLTLVILCLLKLAALRDLAYFSAAAIPACAAALFFYHLLNKLNMLSAIGLPFHESMGLLTRASVFIDELKNNGGFLIMFTSLVLLIIMTIIFAFKNRAWAAEDLNNVPLWTYITFSTVLAGLVVFAPIAVLDREAMVALRYSCFVPVIFLFNVAVYYLFYFKNEDIKIFHGIKIAVFFPLFIFAFIRFALPLQNAISIINYYPPITKFLDEQSEIYKLKCGISNYSNAKLNTVFSKKGIRVYQVQLSDNAIALYHQVNNVNWYIDEKSGKCPESFYNFILAENLSREGVIKHFGMPTDVLTAPGTKLLIYNNQNFNEKLKKYFVSSFYYYNLALKKEGK